MSIMLEQAIADATALKDAALKNAENSLIEKYSGQIKEAVDAILEADEDEGFADDASGGLDIDIGGEETGMESELATNVPLAGADGERLCPCPDDEEEIEIDFDELERQMSGEAEAGLEGDEFAQDELSDIVPDEDDELSNLMEGLDEDGEVVEEEESIDETSEVSEEEKIEEAIENLSREEKETLQRAEKYGVVPNSTSDPYNIAYDMLERGLLIRSNKNNQVLIPMGKEDLDEELNLDEETLEKVMEELAVDFESVPDGWQANNETAKEYDQDLALAKLQATKAKEETKELQKKVKELEESLKRSRNATLKTKNIAEQISKKLNESNLIGTKLLYKNKVLVSVSLNERQKKSLVDTIDEASTIEACKSVYEALKSGMSSKRKQGPKSLSEAIKPSASSLLVSHRNRDDRETSESPQLERMRKLAGIK